MNVLPSVCRRALPLALFASLACGGCVGHTHTVGLGPGGSGAVTARQYYLLFGFASINDVDPRRMAEGLTSYAIDTEFGFVDLLLFPLLLPFTATSRTVTVRT